MVTKIVTLVILFLILAFLFYLTHQIKQGKSVVLVFGQTPISFSYPAGQTAQSTGVSVVNGVNTKTILQSDIQTITTAPNFSLKAITG